MTIYTRYIEREYKRLRALGLVADLDTISPPKIYGYIEVGELFHLLPKEFTNPVNGTVYKTRANFFDVKWKLTSISEYRRFLEWDRQNHKAEEQFYDCDDFAFVLHGRLRWFWPGTCQGVITTMNPAHAKNMVVTYDKRIWEIEPQSDEVKELSPETLVHQYFF